MSPWHLLGTEAELPARILLAIKVERRRIAVFRHDGRKASPLEPAGEVVL